MAYDGTIPSLSNQIGNDIPQMQENFALLEDSQVVDEGSTADGDYIRFENGWQVCIQKKDDGSLDFEDPSNELYRSPLLSQEYPNSFSETPSGGVLGNDGSGGFWITGYTRDDDWRYRYLANQSQTDQDTFGVTRLFAIGRWK